MVDQPDARRARCFAQVDVFGEPAGRGNPVAVVVDADGLDDADMAAFASWTNLSETTFLLPPTDPRADYRVRIFTPARELPFAGHPTLGSAHAWLAASADPDRGTVVQECGAGLVEVRRSADRLAFAAPPLVRSGPLEGDVLAEVVATLGVAADDVLDHAWTDNGPGWASVLLRDADAVLALPLPGSSRLDLGVVGLHPDGTPEVRAFAVDGRVHEDPVTGSLNAGLAQWLTSTGRLRAPYVARQGTAVGRAGRVHVDVGHEPTELWIGGRTTTIVDGTVGL